MKMQTISSIVWIFISIHLFHSPCLFAEENKKSKISIEATQNDNEDLKKIWRRNQIENEARLLVKQERYEEAISKFREATNPSILNHDYEASTARGLIRDLLVLQGNFDQALSEFRYVINRNPNKEDWIDEKMEIEALIKARDTGSKEPIYQHIRYLKEKYKKYLPPLGYRGDFSPIVTTPIIRLYDYIGDYGGGITFVDEILKYFASGKAGDPNKKGKADYAYQAVREAFEEEKREGFKGCLGKSSCVGRATKALIQSDYFPW